MVEVEIETGLSRGGFMMDDVAGAIDRVGQVSQARAVGAWSHLATPEDEVATRLQVEAFARAVGNEADDSRIRRRHLAATGGLFSGRAPLYQGIRPGLSLYGILPDGLPIPDELSQFAKRLRPAMTLKCMPLRVATFPPGTAVGYGGTWVARRESVIATLPVGYGDGWSRASSPGAQAIVRGQRVPLVGTVAMDAVMADVTDVAGVNRDDEFVLLGTQGDQTIDANDVARLRNTIPWEVTTSMSQRLPRVYHADSVLMGIRTLAGEVRRPIEAVNERTGSG